MLCIIGYLKFTLLQQFNIITAHFKAPSGHEKWMCWPSCFLFFSFSFLEKKV